MKSATVFLMIVAFCLIGSSAMASAEPELYVNGSKTPEVPLAGADEDLILDLGDTTGIYTLLNERTWYRRKNTFGYYTDLDTGLVRITIFDDDDSPSAATVVNHSGPFGYWLFNDRNDNGIFEPDWPVKDVILFSQRGLTLPKPPGNDYQWFRMYDVSSYGKASYYFRGGGLRFSGDYDYLLFIDDDHTTAPNWDHNDMVVGINIAGSPATAWPGLYVNGSSAPEVPLAGPSQDFILELCDNAMTYTLLYEETPHKDKNTLGYYTDLGTGLVRFSIFDDDEGPGATAVASHDGAFGYWLFNDLNDNGTFEPDWPTKDVYLFSERGLTLPNPPGSDYQWFKVYNISSYGNADYYFEAGDLEFSGDYDYLLFIDDDHTTGPNWDHNDMVVAINISIPPAPGTPEASTATPCADVSYTISWGTVCGATSYRLYENDNKVYEGPDTSQSFSHLSGSFSYYVAAGNSAGWSDNSGSEAIVVAMPPAKPDTLYSDKPQANPGETYTISWDAVAGSSGYKLYENGIKIYEGDRTDTSLVRWDVGDYYYTLSVCNDCGCSEASNSLLVIVDIISGVLEIDDSEPPRGYALRQNYPNPFNPTTVIDFTVPEGAFVSLEVFDAIGRRIATLVSEHLSAGYKRVVWDGKDHLGRRVSSGIYFYKLSAGDFSDTKKMLLVK